MKSLGTKKLLGVAVSAVLGLGVAGNAQAAASYAVAWDNIFNWSITDSTGALLATTSEFYDSEAHAELNGALVSNGNNGIAPSQSSFAILGQAWPDNNFNRIGPNPPNYGRGDGDIPAGNQSQKIGEAYVQSMGSVETAGGGSVNTLDSTFTVGPNGTMLTFDFWAEKYLEAWTTGNKVGVDFAEADNNFNITISDATGATVFDWSPNGGAGGITGGVENVDSFDLSKDLYANPLNPGPLVYAQGPANFNASTFLLAAGKYSLGVSNEVHAHVSVPEPATLLLFGAGLAGLGFTTRRGKVAMA